MSSPVVTNTSTQLNGASLVYGFPTTLTNAQIKALPTTAIQVVAAPGSGFRIKVLGATLHLDSAAGAYTNIDTSYCSLWIGHSVSLYLTNDVANDSSLATALTNATGFLGSAADALVDQAPYVSAKDAGAASGVGEYVQPGTIQAASAYENQAVTVGIDNNGTGNLTGGNVANSLVVTVYYAVEAV